MQNKYIISGNTVQVAQFTEETTFDSLPPKIYKVGFDKFSGYFLNIISNEFTLPSRLYGNVGARADKCLSAYQRRPNTTGILLTGDKGTGKSLLSSVIANKAIKELNMPVVLVDDPHMGSDFETFLNSLGEVAVLFDEFAKTYDIHNDDYQNKLLSLFDGNEKKKRLILLTENQETDIDDLFLNRPSRVYYHFKYSKLDKESVVDYCKEMGVAYKAEEIFELSHIMTVFSFDILQAIVEELVHNPTDTVQQVIEDLNIATLGYATKPAAVERLVLKDWDNTEVTDIKHASFSLPLSGYDDWRMQAKLSPDVALKFDPDSHFFRMKDEIRPDKYTMDFYFSTDDVVYESNDAIIFENQHYIVEASKFNLRAA